MADIFTRVGGHRFAQDLPSSCLLSALLPFRSSKFQSTPRNNLLLHRILPPASPNILPFSSSWLVLFSFCISLCTMSGEGEREAYGGAAGRGPSSLATVQAKNGTGRGGGASAALGGPRARPGAASSLQRQQEQRRVIRWERFLPRRSLRVLLVEQDDSTRHIVTALLRKCSYRVAAVADGLKAWDVLKDKNYYFDLVLSEVEVPTLSGISLLCKIMANELSKNIPVIMMSSHDSVSVVFRCMQKGAVDFLVKPVRKNELRNLWQHVWRRHCSTSFGNGPGNMPNNQTALENMSDNHAASNDVSANSGKESRTGESCDGGDNQSSGSKPLTQNESSKKQGVFLLVGDRNSARVMKSQSHQLCDDVATLDKSMGVEVAFSAQEITTSEKVQEQIHFYDRPLCKGKDLEYARQKECTDADLRSFGQTAMPYKFPKGPMDFIGSVADGHHSFSPIDNDREGEKALCKTKKSSNPINTCTADSSPSWELSLMRPQLNGSVKSGFQERNILNHSVASAFSRYPHTGIYLPCQKSGSSSATMYIKTRASSERRQLQFDSHDTTNERSASFIPDGRLESSRRNKEDGIVCHQISSCNDEDAEPPDSVPSGEGMSIGYSTSKDTVAFPQSKFGMMPLPIHVGAIPFHSICAGYGPIVQPMFYHEPLVRPQSLTVIVQPKCLTRSDPADYGNQMVVDIQSTAYHNCEENHHFCHLELGKKDNLVNIEQSDPSKPRLHTGGSMEHDDQCGSCSQDIINGSGSNGSGGTADGAVNTPTALDHRNGSELHHYREKCVDPNRSHREAALIKFHLKRKDRCFEKKVRYHSRKMLAEQRPRVKGQFVQQAIVDSNMTATEVDD